MKSEPINDRIAIRRATVIDVAEREVLDRLCGVLLNCRELIEFKLQKLRVQAGRNLTENSGRNACLPELDAAVSAMHHLHTGMVGYPESWDTVAIENCLQNCEFTYDTEQLNHDLRRRVTLAIAIAWKT